MSNQALGSQMSRWCEQEFDEIDFGDERLNQRLIQTATELAQLPQAPINQACQTPSSVKGAYRLFANEKCESAEILQAHVQKTSERIEGYRKVFVIQDTSFLDFGKHKKTQGLGPIAGMHKKNNGGLIVHSALVVGEDGVSLGLLDQRIWARQNPWLNQMWKGKRESAKWIQTLEQTSRLIAQEQVQAITIADRESDFNELLEQTHELGDLPFVIRARKGRVVLDLEQDLEHQRSLMRSLQDQGVALSELIRVPDKRPKRAQTWDGTYRDAQVNLYFGQVRIALKEKEKGEKRSLPLFCVLVMEESPPQNTEPVLWILLTNVPVRSVDDAIERVHWYQQRWHIESFHKVLKSGCTVESCRLESAEKLERYITLMSIVAWKLYWLTHLSRAKPNESCEQALEPIQWKVLYARLYPGKPFPAHPPTLRQAVHGIGRLGGFMGRKSDGEPGIITLWRGYQRLQDMVNGFELIQNLKRCG